MEELVIQLCLILHVPMDCSLPGTSVPGILQAGKLEWVAIPFCRGSSWPMDRTWVFCTAGEFFTIWTIRKPIVCECVAVLRGSPLNSEDGPCNTARVKYRDIRVQLGFCCRCCFIYSLNRYVFRMCYRPGALLATEGLSHRCKWILKWSFVYSVLPE